MLDGAHWYCPESSGETLKSVSAIANESFPVCSRMVERPVLSDLAATTQLLLLSPFPRENCTKSQVRAKNQDVSQSESDVNLLTLTQHKLRSSEI